MQAVCRESGRPRRRKAAGKLSPVSSERNPTFTLRELNLIFTEMQRALARGRSVEFPLGKLTRVRDHFSKYWNALADCPAERPE